MSKINSFNIGLYLGLTPIAVLTFLLLLFWTGRAWFAVDIEVTGIGFLILIISTPIVFIGFTLTFISLFKRNGKNVLVGLLGILSILGNIPLLSWILTTHGQVSSRAYLKVINNSNNDIDSIAIVEPDAQQQFGIIKKHSSKILYYYPDYHSEDGLSYPGISQNYLLMKQNGNTVRKLIPIIHPGEIHRLSLDDYLDISDVHLNKIVSN